MSNRTLYEQVAQTINERYESYSSMTNGEIAKLLNREYSSNMNGATIHTIIQGIKGTRAYLREVLK